MWTGTASMETGMEVFQKNLNQDVGNNHMTQVTHSGHKSKGL